jgi:hypothetical protein
MPYAVCTMHVETRSTSLLIEPQNQGRRFVSVLPQNHSDGFHRFGLKIDGDDF